MKKILIVGGGFMGLGTAWKLSQASEYDITLIEKNEHLGGMSSYESIGSEIWDKYYHVILSSDTKTLNLVNELGLDDQLFWTETKSGFFGEGKLVSMSSAVDFLKFPFLNLWDKFRLGVGIIYSSRIKDAGRLEKIYVKSWMTRVFGRRVYEKIWDPLLRSKLGSGRNKTSATFIWATIKRLYGAREDSTSKVEKMGHMHGGYYRLLQVWENRLKEKGVTIVKNEEALTCSEGCLKTSSGKEFSYDELVFTTSSRSVLEIIQEKDLNNYYWKLLSGQEYLGVRCGVFLLKESLSPYYVINLLDEELPFTGVIESSNVIGTEELHGSHLVYLPRYTPLEELNDISDGELKERFVKGLKKVFPRFDEEMIIDSHIVTEPYVQPLYVLDYGNKVPGFQTPKAHVWMANTSMVVNATLNNNATLELAEKLAGELSKI